MIEAMPAILVNVFTSLLHGGLVVAGLAILKSVKSWPIAILLSFGMSFFSVVLTLATFSLQGWENASKLILPTGELFFFHTFPIIVGTFLSNAILIAAAYGFFVEPGNKKHV